MSTVSPRLLRSVTPVSTEATPPVRSSWRWSTWPLTRKLPMLTGAIVVLVVGSLLALTWRALTTARLEAEHDHLRRVTTQLVETSRGTLLQRQTVYRQVASDSAILTALRAAEHSARGTDSARMPAAANALLRLRVAPDSSLPIELWTTTGRRILHVGTDVRGDSLLQMPPELRTLSGKPITEIPSDTGSANRIRYGALYASGGKVLYWTIVPVRDGARPIGYIAQQRLYRTTPQAARTVREVLGNDAALYLHNATDQFWTNYLGEPTSPLTGIHVASGDYIGERRGVGPVTSYEAQVAGTPWIVTMEAPVSAVLSESRDTLRQLLVVSLLLAIAGVIAVWLVSRRITQPLVSLAAVSEAIARGDLDTRVPVRSPRGTKDEVARLGSSFNRMAAEIEASHRELEDQIEEALTVSSELESTNEQLQQLSADAEEARDAAQTANRAKSDFLAVMSHELRTPLNAIGGYAEILMMEIYGPVTTQQQDALARIVRSQQMLLTLINDVLNFAKLDAGQVEYRMAEVSVIDSLASLETLIAPQLAARELRYEFKGCSSKPHVRADRDKLQQIVLNLLSNAIKFTPQGGRIALSCNEDGAFVDVRVTDTGIGIPEDRLEAIFDPFVQVDRTLNRPHEGVGLGLSISRDLARGMGGSLLVQSGMGAGSTFTLRLRKI